MPGILVFSEKDELALNLLPKGMEIAKQINAELSAVVLGPNAKKRATQYVTHQVDRVYVNDNELFADFHANVHSQALFQIAGLSHADIVLLVSTKRGREIAAMLAQMLGAECFTNVLSLEVKDNKLVTARYGLGGITIISEYSEAPKKVIAMLPQTFETPEIKSDAGQIIDIDLNMGKPDVTVIERIERDKESVDIEQAESLICIGCGLQKKEDLGLIHELADTVKGEIGCTKELASNLGWLSEDRVVGISGKRCKPKVVFSIGISGQSQHVAGIVGSRIIVAINNNKSAPIFRVADYGIVGDLYQLVPELIEGLR